MPRLASIVVHGGTLQVVQAYQRATIGAVSVYWTDNNALVIQNPTARAVFFHSIASGLDPEAVHPDDAPLRRKCLAKIDELKSKPILVALARRGLAYDPEAKRTFHAEAKRALREFARHIGLAPDEFDLRSNPAGAAVSGEITFHSDTLYIQIALSSMGQGREILFRRCNGRSDYCGHRNAFCDIAAITDHARFAALIRRETGVVFAARQSTLV